MANGKPKKTETAGAAGAEEGDEKPAEDDEMDLDYSQTHLEDFLKS